MVQIKDERIVKVIDQFVTEYKIDSKSTYILLEIYTVGSREVMYLSYDDTLYPDDEFLPSYLSVVGEHMIFIKSELNRYIKSDIRPSVNYHLDKLNIQLLDFDLNYLTHFPSWKLIRCEEEDFKIEKIATSLSRDYVPCGYYFDSSKKSKTYNLFGN